MDLEESLYKARQEFLEQLPLVKSPVTMEEVGFRTIYSREVYEKTRYGRGL